MRKIIFAVVLLFMAFSVFAQYDDVSVPVPPGDNEEQGLDFHLNFAILGLGLFLPISGEYIVEMSCELLQFGIDIRGTGLKIAVSPFNYYGWFGEQNIEDSIGIHSFSFINLNLSWSFLSLLDVADNNFFMAPFISASYLFMEQELNTERYVLSAGVQGGIRGGSGKVKYNIFTVEAGYRLVEGTSKFFIGVKYDPMIHWLDSMWSR